MLINKSYRYELNPNNKQITSFKKACGIARFAWNWGLSQRKELYQTKQGDERFTNYCKQNKELNILKKIKYDWMYEASKWVSQLALRNLEEAYVNYYRGKKRHETIGEPKFKKKHLNDRFTIRNDNFHQNKQLIQIKPNSIRIPKISWVKTKESTNKLKGKIISITVSRLGDRWFCSVNVKLHIPSPNHITGDIIGIDVGIKKFATISNGLIYRQVLSPKPNLSYLNRIKLLNKRQSRMKIGSSNYYANSLKLSKLFGRISNIRKDFLSKLSSELAKTKSVICIEDLNIEGIKKNHHLARSVGDEGWGIFRRMLEYKTGWYGSELIIIPRFEPSSKRCNSCGTINHNLKLSDRTWVCLNCGAINDRDPNAANNIRDKGIELLSTDSLSGLQACGVDVRPSSLMAVNCEAGSKPIYLQGCNK